MGFAPVTYGGAALGAPERRRWGKSLFSFPSSYHGPRKRSKWRRRGGGGEAGGLSKQPQMTQKEKDMREEENSKRVEKGNERERKTAAKAETQEVCLGLKDVLTSSVEVDTFHHTVHLVYGGVAWGAAPLPVGKHLQDGVLGHGALGQPGVFGGQAAGFGLRGAGPSGTGALGGLRSGRERRHLTIDLVLRLLRRLQERRVRSALHKLGQGGGLELWVVGVLGVFRGGGLLLLRPKRRGCGQHAAHSCWDHVVKGVAVADVKEPNPWHAGIANSTKTQKGM